MTRELRYLLARFVTCFFAALAVAALVPDGIAFPPEGTRDFWTTITAFAAVLALVNAYVRPVVDVLLKPVTCVLGILTLGLSHVLVSAGVFWLAAQAVEAIEIRTVLGAVIGSVIVGVINMVGSVLLGGRKE